MAQPLSSSIQPTDVYGGDEVSALVLDPGYCHTRAGFAGEDVPKCVVPSFYGSADASRYIGEDSLGPRPGMDILNYMSHDGVVEDWDMAVSIWHSMLVNSLHPIVQTSPTENGLNDDLKDEEGDMPMADAEALEKPLQENPLLMTEAPWNTPKSREKAIEVVMENWACPAFWLSRTPVLAAFASGKASAIVIDVGGANTAVTCIHDGMVLKRSIHRSPVGGLWLSSQIRSLWSNSHPKVKIVPRCMVESKVAVDAGAAAQARLRPFNFPFTDSFRTYHEERVLTEFKESVVEVWHQGGRLLAPGNEEYARSQTGPVFEMPDGSNQMWREQRYRVAEGMWDEAAQLPVTGNEPTITAVQTIPELVRAALNAVDVDLRPNLLANVVVTGSSSLTRGFSDRLHQELTAMFPAVRIKLHAAGLTTERRFGAWLGGSILASLGTFHQMWISRKEYEEHGPGIVEKRCK